MELLELHYQFQMSCLTNFDKIPPKRKMKQANSKNKKTNDSVIKNNNK